MSGPRKGQPKTAKVRKQVRHNGFYYWDEGEALTRMLERAGSTLARRYVAPT